MTKINYKMWKLTFPYLCIECGSVAHSKTQYCQRCGKEDTLRETTKKDYKLKFKKMKEL